MLRPCSPPPLTRLQLAHAILHGLEVASGLFLCRSQLGHTRLQSLLELQQLAPRRLLRQRGLPVGFWMRSSSEAGVLSLGTRFRCARCGLAGAEARNL